MKCFESLSTLIVRTETMLHHICVVSCPQEKLHKKSSRPAVMSAASSQLRYLIVLVCTSHVLIICFHSSWANNRHLLVLLGIITLYCCVDIGNVLCCHTRLMSRLHHCTAWSNFLSPSSSALDSSEKAFWMAQQFHTFLFPVHSAYILPMSQMNRICL